MHFQAPGLLGLRFETDILGSPAPLGVLRAEPTVRSGGFKFEIGGPTTATGPSFGLGFYNVQPACRLRGAFRGSVELPPGAWEVGIIQNLAFDYQTEFYSQGGIITWALSGPLWDSEAKQNLAPGQSRDVWFNTSAVSTHIVSGSRSQTVTVEVDWSDDPSNPEFPSVRKRCNDSIIENFEKFERSLQFIAVLCARNQHGLLFPMLATSAYGSRFKLTRAAGGIDDSWLDFEPIFPTAFERPPFVGAAAKLAFTGKVAKERAGEKRQTAVQVYLSNCRTTEAASV